MKKALEITRRKNVPLLLDDAGGIPPLDNLSRYAKLGVDLYCFSGGKGLRGPQCAGVLLGRKDLIDAAVANSNPYEGAVCRPMKAGKEEIIGMLTAIETWEKVDMAVLNNEWNARVNRISKVIETVPGVSTKIYVPEEANSYPTLRVIWDEGNSVSTGVGRSLEPICFRVAIAVAAQGNLRSCSATEIWRPLPSIFTCPVSICVRLPIRWTNYRSRT